MLYVVAPLPAQTGLVPDIVPGWAGTLLTVTVIWLGVPSPQALRGVTLMVPLAVPAVKVMLLVVDEPDQPVPEISQK